MRYLEEKSSIVSTLIKNQFPQHVQENNPEFINFLSSYYESQEGKYGPFDIAANLLDYYNVTYYRPNRLVESVELTSLISDSDTTINVKSTIGYPNRGYIKIDDEIIFYKSKTINSFVDCVRGTSALVLSNVPKSYISLQKSTKINHVVRSKVYNIAFNYSNEFFSRIKSELGVLIPEVLDESLDVGEFLKKIKSFYSSKGSLNSHRVLFRILFNDRRFDVKLNNRGSGAKLDIPNFNGEIPDPSDFFDGSGSGFIKSKGNGYDNRIVNGELINSPIIEVYGTGTGSVDINTKLRKNKTAVVKVSSIGNYVDGSDTIKNGILDVNVEDVGIGYIGPITTLIRPRKFDEDQIVTNIDATGVGRVEYYDPKQETIILYDIIGTFRQGQEIYSTSGEKPRAFISAIPSIEFKTRQGVEILSENQEIEFPREYTFKTSNTQSFTRRIIRSKLFEGQLLPGDTLPDAFSLTQNSDKLFGVKGVSIEIDNRTPLSDDMFEFEISSNSDINDIYLQPSTIVTRSVSVNSNTETVITVDEASGFPVTNGILSISGSEITYKTRTAQQFYGCKLSDSSLNPLSLNIEDEVISFGRYKLIDTQDEWASNVEIVANQYKFYNDNLYISTLGGTTGTTAPSHTTGVVSDGGVLWRYYDTNRYDHSFYINFNDSSIVNPKFRLFGLPGDVIIEQSGSLNSLTKYQFAKLDDPNINVYNFKLDNELAADRSDRLALVLSSNYNRNRNIVDDTRLPSYLSLSGFNTHYDYNEYVYIATSCIPPWWQDIISYPTIGQDIPANDLKKVSFKNQKNVCRWLKEAILYSPPRQLSSNRKTKKTLGLQVDAIQLNSYKGNTVNYGYINAFSIIGGQYGISYSQTGGIATSIDTSKNPLLLLTEGTTTQLINNSNNLTRISGSITKINFAELFSEYQSDLIGFTEQPTIEVVNQNPQLVINYTNISSTGNTYPGFNITDNVITKNSHGLKTLDKVKFISDSNYFQSLISNTEYFVRVFANNKFSLYKTKSQALLNDGKVSLKPNYTNTTSEIPVSLTNVTFRFESPIKNPFTGFEESLLELSYSDGNIDNIIIRKFGKGYINLPKIIIKGGGKSDFEVPFSKNLTKFIEMSGPLVSYYDYDNENYNISYANTDNYPSLTTNTFQKSPTVDIIDGRNGEGVAFIDDGKVSSVVVSNPGEYYYSSPTIEVIGDGKDAVIRAIVTTNGEIQKFDVINSGSGYTSNPEIKIIPSGGGGVITTLLKEWTFNLVRQLKNLDRIDNYGGYVFDSADATPTTSNPQSFKLIDYKNDFPKDLEQKQYFLLKPSYKLAARQIRNSAPDYLLNKLATAIGVTVPNLTDAQLLGITGVDAIDNESLHSLAYAVSYDGIPIFDGTKVLTNRNEPVGANNPLVEAVSQYKLKYSTSSNSINETSYLIGSTTYYVSRVGGPSIIDYPIGSFIEDYEYVEGDDDALDTHNGRFCITPEFPEGRYIYITTKKSYDPITNTIIDTSQNIDFNGFPYFIGDTFASEYDDYMNNRCRTNDTIPKSFVRAFEKKVPEVVSTGDTKYFGTIPSGEKWFDGLDENINYPKENTDKIISVAGTSSVSGGTIDAIIIENKGNGYKVGDTLDVNNSKTFGSGFSGFISKVGGKFLVLGPAIKKTSDFKTVTFETITQNELSIGDLIEFNYDTTELDYVSSPIFLPDSGTDPSSNIKKLDNVEVSIGTVKVGSVINSQVANGRSFANRRGPTIESLKDKLIYSITLNSKFKYELKLPVGSTTKLTYDIESINEYFTLISSPTDTVRLDMNKVPNRIYLHITYVHATKGTVETIYQIDKINGYSGSYNVIDIDKSKKQFTVQYLESTKLYENRNLKYASQSFGPSGPIEEVIITNTGNNYRKLPTISGIIKKGTTSDEAGDGTAIIQTNSSTIGKIKRIHYDSIGTSFTSNNNVNYYLNIPATAKIINNFEIYDVEILNGGKNYDNVVTILVDGSSTKAKIKATVSVGNITSLKVIDGGMNFSKLPTITVSSLNGSGATFKAKIRRKHVPEGQELTGDVNSILFPIGVTGSVKYYDDFTSVLEYDEVTGQFKENQIVYLKGKPYGKIISIRRTKAYAKVSPSTTMNTTRSDISGNTSEVLQKLTDSNYYQDWSYSITSSRDTSEWKKDQNILTHPAGFKQFGKKQIRRRKSVFKNQQNIFKSNVNFGTKFFNKIDLSVNLANCQKQKLAFIDTSVFTVGNYYFGVNSTAIGEVISVSETFVEILLRNAIKFVVNEAVVDVSLQYLKGFNEGTFKSIVTVNGILQEPFESYEISTNFAGDQSFIPRFDISANDEIAWYKLQSKFIKLNTQSLSSTSTTFSFTNNEVGVVLNDVNSEQFIISIGGAVQNPSSYGTISDNSITLTSAVGYEGSIVALQHDNLRKLTFTEVTAGTVYTLNYTPSDHCNLLIFANTVGQTQLLTDFNLSGNTITFSEPVNLSGNESIFGWEINETVTCSKIDSSTLSSTRPFAVMDCITKRFTQDIESNGVKKPDSIYEIRKKQITGTVVPENSTTVTGFDSKFTSTTPRYSKSYVEILDPLTFDGSTKSFILKRNGQTYTPQNGEESLIIQSNISGTKHVLDYTEYAVSGSTITFNTAYAASVKCTILDYESTYISNVSNENGSVLDRLFTKQDGSRRTFSVSDAGVPIYSKNVGDIFTIKNGKLLTPDSSQHSITDNKITFVDAPTSSDSIVLTHFNRQLLPDYSNNVVLDDFVCADGVITDFPITLPGASRGSVIWNNINHIFIVRNGVYQKPGTDFTLVNNKIIRFTTAPTKEESGLIFAYVSQAGATQNLLLDDLTGFNGSTSTFNLTHSGGTAFTPPDIDDIFVVRNGAIQSPGTTAFEDYNIPSSPGNTISFQTAPNAGDDIWILYTHNSSVVTIDSIILETSSTTRIGWASGSATADPLDINDYVVYADGVPRFAQRGDWVFETGTANAYRAIILTHSDGYNPQNVFVMKHANTTLINDLEECQDGTKTTFRVLENGQDVVDPIIQPDDILVVKNGIVLQKTADYTVAGISDITFVTAPLHTDNILLIRSDGMVHSTLTNTSGNTYTISNSETTEKSNVVVFSNNEFKFEELGDFTWNSNSSITLSSAHTTGNLFAIKFDGLFKLLDPINNIFNGSNTKFNLMDGQKFLTPTSATYTASSGNLVLTIPNHGLTQGTTVKIAANSLNFTCSMDNNYRTKSYPRTSDPSYDNNITISSVTTNTLTLPIGASPIVNYTPGVNTTYNTTTGNLVLDIGTSGAAALTVGTKIKLATGAVTFSCTSAPGKYSGTQLSHPRAIIDSRTPESASYDSSTGILTIDLSEHGWINDDWVKLEDNALTFTCTKDSNATNHSYPRSTDPISGKFIQISNVTTNTFDMNVGISPAGEQYTHNFVSAVTNSLKKKRDRHDTPLNITDIDTTAGTITINVGPSSEKAPHTFVSGLANSIITGGNYIHTFVSAKSRSVIIGNVQENFVPIGTTSNDNIPHETGIIVVKNGSILDPGVDYTLTGSIKSQISLTTAPSSSDIISVRVVGMFDKLDTISSGSGTTFSITKGSAVYYANNDIDRPRKLENQIMVIMDGNVQSPLYDYIIRHDKIIFESSVSFTKLVLLDFRGNANDIKTTSRLYEVSVGDKIYIDGEISPRTVTSIKSPDLLITNSYTDTTPSGFVGTSTPSNGRLSTVTVASNGLNYTDSVILRTVGTGNTASFNATTNVVQGGIVTPSDVIYPGENIQNQHDVYATVQASVYKELPLHSTELRRATKLDADINASVETVALDNVSGLTANTPTITVAGYNGGGSEAVLRPHISNGEIRKVEIISGGANYQDKDFSITLTGGGGTGCILRGTINGSGTITAVDVVNSGTGYDTNRVILYHTSGGVVTSEIIEYTELSDTTGTANLLGCTRGASGTTAVSHSAQIESPDNASTYTLVYFDNYL
jgi:hypothetical protein